MGCRAEQWAVIPLQLKGGLRAFRRWQSKRRGPMSRDHSVDYIASTAHQERRERGKMGVMPGERERGELNGR